MGSAMDPRPGTQVDRTRARQQLRWVLGVLVVLDTGVLACVIGLALAWTRFHWPTAVFLVLLLLAVGLILLARVWIGIRLHRRAGELF